VYEHVAVGTGDSEVRESRYLWHIAECNLLSVMHMQNMDAIAAQNHLEIGFAGIADSIGSGKRLIANLLVAACQEDDGFASDYRRQSQCEFKVTCGNSSLTFRCQNGSKAGRHL
jgi:hypothetical protein